MFKSFRAITLATVLLCVACTLPASARQEKNEEKAEPARQQQQREPEKQQQTKAPQNQPQAKPSGQQQAKAPRQEQHNKSPSRHKPNPQTSHNGRPQRSNNNPIQSRLHHRNVLSAHSKRSPHNVHNRLCGSVPGETAEFQTRGSKPVLAVGMSFTWAIPLCSAGIPGFSTVATGLDSFSRGQ
jgi:hypothetical protein